MVPLRIATTIAAVIACAGCRAHDDGLDAGADAACREVRPGCACDLDYEFRCGTPEGDLECSPTGTWVHLADGCGGLDAGADRVDAGCREVRHGCACDVVGEIRCGTPAGDLQCYPTGTWVHLADGCGGLDAGLRADAGAGSDAAP